MPDATEPLTPGLPFGIMGSAAQNFEIGSHIVDSTFNKQELNFKFIRANIKALYGSCNKYKVSLHSYFYSSINIFEAFQKAIIRGDDTVESSADSPLCSNKIPEILGNFCQMRGLPELVDITPDIHRLNKQIQVMAHKVEQDLVYFELNVQRPLLILEAICGKIARTIEYREATNMELSSLVNKKDSYSKVFKSNSKPLTARQEIERMKCEKKIELVQEKYEAVNTMLKTQLDGFFTLFTSFITEWFNCYYFTTYRISFSLYNFTYNNPEFRKVSTRSWQTASNNHDSNCHNPTEVLKTCLTSEEINLRFHKFYDIVLDEIEQLHTLKPKSMHLPISRPLTH